MSWLQHTLVVLMFLIATSMGYAADPDKKKDSKEAPTKKKEDADGKDDLDGKARWEWTLMDKEGKADKTGTFMAHTDGSIVLQRKKGEKGEDTPLGTWKKEKGKIIMTFTKGKLKGDATIELAERKPSKYKGDHTSDKGNKAKIELIIVND